MTQRKRRKKGKLSRERTTRLEGIGFNWDARKMNKDEQWEEKINELVVYQEKNGNCNVPWSQDSLGRWVDRQCTCYKNGNLSLEHTAQIENIGFNWGARKEDEDKQWEERFIELAVYKRGTGTATSPKIRVNWGTGWANNVTSTR